MSTCRACPAEIRWARTTNGKTIPLDAEPDPAGNVRLVDDVAHVIGPDPTLDPDDDGVRYMPHHATCPGWGKR